MLKYLLFPFAAIYSLVLKVRNLLFDYNILKTAHIDIPVISIGNLRVGGTGKTPFTIYLSHLLSDYFNTAVLSRGYGRITKGFLLVTEKSLAKNVGDEPLLIAQKTKKPVAVCEDRVLGAVNLINENSEVNALILDDAFQHRYLNRDINILLTAFDKPFTEDFVLPAGRLRENRKMASRANVIVVTRCPRHINNEEKFNLISKIKKYSQAKVYFSGINYQEPELLLGPKISNRAKIMAVSALANSNDFENYANQHFKVIHCISYRDHFPYPLNSVIRLLKIAEEKGISHILTTEKDAVKLMEHQVLFKEVGLIQLGIECYIHEEEDFKKEIQKRLQKWM